MYYNGQLLHERCSAFSSQGHSVMRECAVIVVGDNALPWRRCETPKVLWSGRPKGALPAATPCEWVAREGFGRRKACGVCDARTRVDRTFCQDC